ncbi:MAG TPA: MFS transporter [Desulfobacteraceae bacterium]|nr:MFS transporter [Desulfobacteraceae bacterium]HPJ68438.1 MFS transporter [Desulfobacteraceae bacterium]HPQ28710.1 MFS transporter [Desulfobacteraceae bacterium]
MKYRSVGLLTLAHMSTDINQGAIPVLLPFFIAAHDLTYAAAAAIVFTTTLVSTITQPVFGYVADRLSRPWLVPIGVILAGFGLSCVGLAPTYGTGLIAVGLSGIGVAAFHPEGARLVNRFAGAKKATAMSIFAIGGLLGFASGPLVANFALLRWGLKGTAFLALPAITVTLLLVFFLPGLWKQKDAGVKTDIQEQVKGTDEWGSFSCLAFLVLIRSVIFYGINTFLPLFWINVLNQSRAAGAFALSLFFTSGIVGNILGGRLADRVGLRIAVVTEFLILTVIFPIFVYTSDPLWAMFMLIPIGLLNSAATGPLIVLGQTYLPNRVGFASGITLGLAFSFGGIITPVLGWIADHHGLHATFTVLAFLPIACTILAVLLPSDKRQNPER